MCAQDPIVLDDPSDVGVSRCRGSLEVRVTVGRRPLTAEYGLGPTTSHRASGMAEDADGNVPPAILTPGGEEFSEEAIAAPRSSPPGTIGRLCPRGARAGRLNCARRSNRS